MEKIDTNNYLDQSLDLKFVKDKEDFVRLINQLRMKHSSRNIKPIPLSRFTFFANPELSVNRYETFEIAKKNGEKRKIHAPKMSYKAILSGLDLFFRQHYKTHPNVMGFAEGKSIFHNAKPHVRKKYVLNIDLKDFFHSFERKHVKWALVNAPLTTGFFYSLFMYPPNGDRR